MTTGSFRCDWKNCKNSNSFTHDTSLWRHIKEKHLFRDAFKCPASQCSKAYGRRDKMREHWQSAHADSKEPKESRCRSCHTWCHGGWCSYFSHFRGWNVVSVQYVVKWKIVHALGVLVNILGLLYLSLGLSAFLSSFLNHKHKPTFVFKISRVRKHVRAWSWISQMRHWQRWRKSVDEQKWRRWQASSYLGNLSHSQILANDQIPEAH